jgi:hypothetical protein
MIYTKVNRVYLLLKSKTDRFPDYIFEFKVSKTREDLELDAKKALKEIEILSKE